MAGHRETALKNLTKADCSEAGKKSRKPRFSLKGAIQKKIETRGAEETLDWIEKEYPEKYIDLIRDIIKGEIQKQIKIKAELETEVEHVLDPEDQQFFREIAKAYGEKKLQEAQSIEIKDTD